MDSSRFRDALERLLSAYGTGNLPKNANAFMIARHETVESAPPRAKGFQALTVAFDLRNLSTLSERPHGQGVITLTLFLRKRHFGRLMLSASPSQSKLFRYTVDTLAVEDLQPARPMQPVDPELLCSLFQLMAVIFAERREEWEIALESLALALLAAVFSDSPSTCTKQTPDATVGLVIQEIAAHPESCTLSNLAQRYSYNPSYLSTLLREKCGRTFSDLLLEQRMARARTLLENTALPVATVSSAVGYASTTSFYRNFSAYFGASPSQMRAGGPAGTGNGRPAPARDFSSPAAS